MNAGADFCHPINTMKSGDFSADQKEFVITNPDLPRPWINYLFTDDYCAVISQTGGGYSFLQDCRRYRINAWNPEYLYADRPGRYVFLRDRETGEYWSVNWQPLCPEKQDFTCVHGMGHTTIRSRHNGIDASVEYLVPPKDSLELWRVTLRNTGPKSRQLGAFTYWHLILNDYQEEIVWKNIFSLYNFGRYDRGLKAAILSKSTHGWFGEFPYLGFMGSTCPVKAFETRKEAFWGANEVFHRPKALEEGKLSNGACFGENMIASLQHDISVPAGGVVQFTVIAGLGKTKIDVGRLLKKYRKPGAFDEARRGTDAVWAKRLDGVWVKTPDRDFDCLTNYWTKYQLWVANSWSRSPSFYHEGMGGGKGYRDSCQDAEGILSLAPDYVRDKLVKIARCHFRDGHCAPGWSDMTGLYKGEPRADHPAWFVYTVHAYVRESGDRGFLKHKVEWADGGKGTIFDHVLANLEHLWKHRGAHGMPLIGIADWNDAIDQAGRKGKGESVWLGIAFYRSLLAAAELAEQDGKRAKAKELRGRAAKLKEIINSPAGWDGKWYRGGYTDNGKPFGSAKCKQGKIHINSQSWAVLGNVCEGDRLKRVLKSIDTMCDSKYGPVLLAPAYTTPDPTIGRITKFAAGTKENASVFCHAVMFKAVADCMAKRADAAYKSICAIMPSRREEKVYKAEPYSYAEYVIGPAHPYLAGEGAFTWITGSAGWAFLAATEWILGARREFNGLRIDPCLPSSWKRAFITRRFRGTTYEIDIERKLGVKPGEKRITLDGKSFAGDILPARKDGKTHKVRVLIGPRNSRPVA